MTVEIVNMHEAKTNLSKLVERINKQGGAFIIAKAGVPMARVTGIQKKPCTGMLRNRGQIRINQMNTSIG